MGALPKPKFPQPAQGQTCRQASLRMAVSGLLTLFCTAGYEHKQDKGNRMFIIFSKPHILLIEGKTGKERRKENDSKGMEITGSIVMRKNHTTTICREEVSGS